MNPKTLKAADKEKKIVLSQVSINTIVIPLFHKSDKTEIEGKSIRGKEGFHDRKIQ